MLLVAYILSVASFANAGSQKSDGESAAPRVVPRLTQKVVIDGTLDEAAWSDALSFELKYEFMPGDNIEAKVRTEVLIAYDESNFYIGFRCWDPRPEEIRAYHARRDEFGGDWICVNIDTFNDHRRCISLAVNTLGTQWDAIRYEQDLIMGWDAIWSSASTISDWGWESELAIPFSSIEFQRAEATQTWGFDAWRRYPREFTYTFALVPLDRNRDYFAQLMKIEGFEGVSPGRNIEITPTFVAGRSDARADMPDGDFENVSSDAEFGLTTSWGITPNMTLQGTVNPDFSQVEADALQLDINEPFALYYDEKRPFFTNNADFFNTDLNAVYTRTIRDPSWGIKLAGKEGSNTIGVYVMRDEVTNLILPGKLESQAVSLDRPNYSSIFRYRREFGRRYAVGLLATDREGDDYYNRVFGVDGDFFVTDSDRVRMQYLASSTSYPQQVADRLGQAAEADGIADGAYSLSYWHETRNLTWVLEYKDVGDGFRTDMGYNTRVDYRTLAGEGEYHWRAPAEQWWAQIYLGGGLDYTRDRDDNPLKTERKIWFGYEGPMESTLELWARFNQETALNGEEFDVDCGQVSFGFSPTRMLELDTVIEFGAGVDYANSRPARRLSINPSLFLFAGRNITLNFNHLFERLTVAQGRLYTANISDATVYYHFNRRSYVRAILQYIDYDRVAELYKLDTDSRYERLFTQFLFSYEINPRTVLYLGYSGGYAGTSAYGLAQSDRVFFAKIGYAWVL